MMGIASGAERLVIHKIIGSLRRFPDQIATASVLPNDRLLALLESEILNEPELFFVNGFKLMSGPVSTLIYPSYSYDEPAFHAAVALCRIKAKQLISKTCGADDYTRVLQIHDLLARNVVYVDGRDKELYSIVGPLTRKQGVCEGFAKTFKYLLDGMGIPCRVISGAAFDQGRKVEDSHAWNLVQLDGRWFHVDVTFDTTVRNGQTLRYDYFCLTDDQILRDHRYEAGKYPSADCGGYGYYERHGLVMNTRKDMRDHVMGALRSGETDCVFKLPDSPKEEGLDKKVSAELQKMLEQQGIELRYMMNFNIKQRVFQISVER